TIVCRCEDVTAGQIDASGAKSLSAVKIVTRCGQGPCQGRVCERLVAGRLPEPERFSARAPIRPIPLSALMDAELPQAEIRAMPASTGVMHARTTPMPSTTTRHSWQTPIPQ